MNDAMECWFERAGRGTRRVGALVLLVCLTLTVNSLPISTFKATTVSSSSSYDDDNRHHHQPSPTQSTVVAMSAMSWDDKTATTAGKSRSETRHPEGNTPGGDILSTVQTFAEDNSRISTRKRRSHGGNHNFLFNTARQMHCKNGYLLAIYDNETINGTKNKYDLHTRLLITSVGFGEVKIRGVRSGLFVCMNSYGKLYPSPDATRECVFQEEFLRTMYAVFSSRAYGTNWRKRWYIGLGSNGRPRLGRKTRKKHPTTHFIVESVKDGTG